MRDVLHILLLYLKKMKTYLKDSYTMDFFSSFSNMSINSMVHSGTDKQCMNVVIV